MIAYLAAAQGAIAAGPAEQIVFWIVAPLAILGALGMVLSRGAVHSALWLVLVMLCLGTLYITQEAEFLGLAQFIVYTGAIMMLFLFVLMLTGRDSGDSVIEVLRGHRVTSLMIGIGLVGLMVAVFVRSIDLLPNVGLAGALEARGAVGSLAAVIFTDFLFPFELTAALLITAAIGAMVLAHVEKTRRDKRGQKELAIEREHSGHPTPLPGPGVHARSSSNATPGMLPDGSIAPGSVSPLVETAVSEWQARRFNSDQRLTPIAEPEHPVRGKPAGELEGSAQ